MTERNTDDSHKAAQALAEAMKKDPIGFAKGFNEMVRLSHAASGSKPSMAAAGNFHAAVQMSLRADASEVALDTLPLLLDVFSRASDLRENHTLELAELAKEFEEIGQHDGAVKILDTVVGVRRRLLGEQHAGTWTARAELAEALRKASQLERAQQEIDLAIRACETTEKTTSESTMHVAIEAHLHSLAGVIAQEANDDTRALEHLAIAFRAGTGVTRPLDQSVAAMNYARSLIKVGRADEAVEILSREVPKLKAIPLEDGSERRRLTEVANIVAEELGALGFSQLGMKLAEIAAAEKPGKTNEEDIKAAVHGLVAQARSLKYAGRLNEAAAKYKQSLALLDEATADPDLRKLRAIVLDNTLGLFSVRYGVAQQRGILEHDTPLGEFEEARLIEQTRLAFEEAYEKNDINVAMFFGNLGTLHSMGGRPREAEAAYDKAMQIFATHPSGNRDIDLVRNRIEIERANMRKMHPEQTVAERRHSIDVDALRKLDEDLIRTGGRFSSQRINQLTLWSTQLFHDNQGGAAMDFCRDAVAAAMEYLRIVSEHSEFGGHAMMVYQPQVVRQAFRLEMNYHMLTTMGKKPPSTPDQIGFLNHIYALAQLEMSSSVSSAFALAGGARQAALSVLTDVHTIEATQNILNDGEYLVIVMNTESLCALVTMRPSSAVSARR